MSALVRFDFERQPVRVLDRGGETWFVGRDVCAALGHRNSRDSLKRIPDDEKGVANTDTLGGNQEMVIISEAGLYRLVLTSRSPAAERFKSWVVRDVLPAIRRTGAYALPAANDDGPDDDALDFESDDGRASILARLAFVRHAGRTFGRHAAQEAWRRVGLPDIAPAAAALYVPGPDPDLDGWRRARLLAMPGHTTRSQILYQDYERWCRATDAPARSLAWFGRRLRASGVQFRKEGGGFIAAVGVALAPPGG
jgi:prophage antirepressor-like protein